MQKSRQFFAVLCVAVLLLSVTVVQAMPQDASFVGTWEIAMSGGRQGGGGGNRGGGAGNRSGGQGKQSLTITQNGEKFKVSHKTRRGENAYDATVSSNTISWTEVRQGRGGNSMSIEYKATQNGDTLTGTMRGGRFTRDFTAKRSN